jgi:hypothetical protein
LQLWLKFNRATTQISTPSLIITTINWETKILEQLPIIENKCNLN